MCQTRRADIFGHPWCVVEAQLILSSRHYSDTSPHLTAQQTAASWCLGCQFGWPKLANRHANRFPYDSSLVDESRSDWRVAAARKEQAAWILKSASLINTQAHSPQTQIHRWQHQSIVQTSSCNRKITLRLWFVQRSWNLYFNEYGLCVFEPYCKLNLRTYVMDNICFCRVKFRVKGSDNEFSFKHIP